MLIARRSHQAWRPRYNLVCESCEARTQLLASGNSIDFRQSLLVSQVTATWIVAHKPSYLRVKCLRCAMCPR